jgi:hypothetical protein
MVILLDLRLGNPDRRGGHYRFRLLVRRRVDHLDLIAVLKTRSSCPAAKRLLFWAPMALALRALAWLFRPAAALSTW